MTRPYLTVIHHVSKSWSSTAKQGKNYNAVHFDFQSQCNWNRQNLCIAPIKVVIPLCVSISVLVAVSVPVPRDSSIRNNPPQSTTHQRHEIQMSRVKIAMQFILTLEVNATRTAKTTVLLFCVSMCANWPFTLAWLVRRQHPTTCWNYCQGKLSRAKIAMQVMMTFKVNAIGTAKTFVLLQSQYLFVFVCPPVFQFQSHVTRPYATTTHRNPPCIEVIKYSKAGPKLQCGSFWLSKSMQF